MAVRFFCTEIVMRLGVGFIVRRFAVFVSPIWLSILASQPGQHLRQCPIPLPADEFPFWKRVDRTIAKTMKSAVRRGKDFSKFVFVEIPLFHFLIPLARGQKKWPAALI